MQILGIDYGRKKIGLATADDSGIAEPLVVIRAEDPSKVFEKLGKIIKEKNIEKIVVGNPGGKMEEEIKKFADDLKNNFGLPIAFQDETLSTNEAINLSIEANIKRKKRKEMEDSYAAVVILQEYLDR